MHDQKKILRVFINALVVFLIFCSCSRSKDQVAGICISFDDNNLENWVGILPLLRQYNIKATFFLNGVSSYSDFEKQMVLQLKEAGHDIGAHGENHVSVNSYIEEHGVYDYWNNEISGQDKGFKDLDIKAQIFAYPYGEKNSLVEMLLLSKYKAVRNVSFLKRPVVDRDEIYFKKGKLRKTFTSLGIDNIEEITNQDILQAVNRAVKNREVIFLHAHDIGFEKGYEISPSRLEFLFEQCKKLGVRSFSYSDIVS